MIDRAGLEIRYTPFGYRGFESLTLRKKERVAPSRGYSFSFISPDYSISQFLTHQHDDMALSGRVSQEVHVVTYRLR